MWWVNHLFSALQSLWGPGDYKEEIGDMLAEQAAMEAAPPKTPLQLIRNRNVRWQLITMAFIYGCNQLSGSSAVRRKLSLATNWIHRYCKYCNNLTWNLICRSTISPMISSYKLAFIQTISATSSLVLVLLKSYPLSSQWVEWAWLFCSYHAVAFWVTEVRFNRYWV